MDSTNIARSRHNKKNRSEEIFTLSGCEDSLLTPVFLESTEQTKNDEFDSSTQTVPTNTEPSENNEFKTTSADILSGPSEEIEEEPKLKPQDLLIWALKENKFDRFSSLLEVPGVDPTFKYGKPYFTTCMELACRLHWGGKFVKALLEHGVKPNVQEIHPEPIHYAAKYGNPEALEALLKNKKTKINVVDSSGRTALHHAVIYSQKGREAEYARCIVLLLERPDFALNITDTTGCTAVHEAAKSNKKALDLILKYRNDDVDLVSYRSRGRTARECILRNYPDLRKLLPEYRIKYQSLDDNSQLLIALQNRQLETFHDILCQIDEDGKSRVDPNYCYGRPHFATCLEIACREKDCADFVKELLRAGADPNFVNPTSKQTALQVAVKMRNIHVLCVLLKDRRTNINTVHDEVKQVIAELDHQTDDEEIMQDDEEANIHVPFALLEEELTPFYAAHGEDNKVIQHDQQTRNGDTMQGDEGAKHYWNAMQELKRILHKRTSEIRLTQLKNTNKQISELEQTLFQHLYERNYEDFKKKFSRECKDTTDGYYTLLQYATLHRLEEIAQMLLDHGADPNATTEREKRSPLLIACMNNDNEIMKLLLSSATHNTLDVNVKDAKGNTALHYVSNTEYLDCVVDLMRCGADIKHKNIFGKSPLPAKSV